MAVDIGSVMGMHAPEFFRDYKLYLQGPSSTFNAPEIVRVGIASYQFTGVAVGLTSGYYRGVVRETYLYRSERIDTSLRLPTQTLYQEITATAIPSMLTVDYVPNGRQFTTYAGAGIGMTVLRLSWNEELTASQASGARRSGERYNKTHLVPTFMARTGVSLGLDKHLTQNASAAIHIEVSYTYGVASAPLFSRIAKDIPTATPLAAPYRVDVGGIGIHAGISIFLR
ncbi:MAG: hypothetical protein FGM24_02115 [Candidatus Kapabacteria bacterium]|nr:hypothetical protein [Candidatus Kapabacteria bacterium]